MLFLVGGKGAQRAKGKTVGTGRTSPRPTPPKTNLKNSPNPIDNGRRVCYNIPIKEYA